jgi:co-chaperonin GroES (HSP10)
VLFRSVGDSAWLDQPSPWAKEGDHVIFGKYSGLIYDGADKKEYRIINDLDVVAIVD